MTAIIKQFSRPVIEGAGLQPATPSRRQLLVLLCVSVPSFMINLDANIVAVSLPSIGRTLNADFAATEWVISAYTLAFASLLLPAGALADRFGRKRLLLVGLALFTAASILCGAAPTIVLLNAGRAIQGAGAALLLSAALATLADAFRGHERAAAFAFWGTVIGVAMTIGPIVGGVITHRFGWPWAFYVNVPVGLAMFGLSSQTIRESRDPEAQSVDLGGAVVFAATLFCLTLALISVNQRGWNSLVVLNELFGAFFLGVLFVWVEHRQTRPMLDFSYFRQSTFVGANVANLAYAATLLPMLTFLPLYFQSAFAKEPEVAGLMMLPMVAPLVLVPRLVVRFLAHRFSGRGLLTLGLALATLGLIELGLVADQIQFSLIVAGMLVAGSGAGILNAEAARVAMTAIPHERAGMAAGIGGTVRFAGLVVGFAALGAILYSTVASNVAMLMPDLSNTDRAALIHGLMSGGIAEPHSLGESWDQVRLTSIGHGYRALFFSAAAVAVAAAVACWRLVQASETPMLRVTPHRIVHQDSHLQRSRTPSSTPH